jgi:hypothetical protein
MISVVVAELLYIKSEEEMNSKNLIIEKEVSSVICCLRNYMIVCFSHQALNH